MCQLHSTVRGCVDSTISRYLVIVYYHVITALQMAGSTMQGLTYMSTYMSMIGVDYFGVHVVLLVIFDSV